MCFLSNTYIDFSRYDLGMFSKYSALFVPSIDIGNC